MIKTVRTSSAHWEVETLPDGSLGNLNLVECRRLMPVTIEDGLIVRDKDACLDVREFRGQMRNNYREIVFTIVMAQGNINDHLSQLECVRIVAMQSSVVRALFAAGWMLTLVWEVAGDEF